MEGKSILLDTGILIDYFRKKDKSKSILFKLSLESFHFHVSAVTQYEILLGATDSQIEFWTIFFDKVQVLPFDQNSALAASVIYKQLKSENKLIDIAEETYQVDIKKKFGGQESSGFGKTEGK